MKTTLALLFSFFWLGISAQELFTVQGKIQQVSYSQGGMELPPEMYMPHALPNTKLYVVQFYGEEEKTTIVANIISDEHGNYEVKLPPGKYGFVQHKTEVGKGVYLPGWKTQNEQEFEEIMPDDGYGHQNYWVLSTATPFEVVNQDLQNINLTHYDISICYMCP